MEIVRLLNGTPLGVRVGRLFVYMDRRTFPSTRSGGCMVTRGGKRQLARHVFWRLCWVRDG